MKKILTAAILLFTLYKSNAQNVGIGTATPQSKLHIIDTATTGNKNVITIEGQSNSHSFVLEKKFFSNEMKPAMVVTGKPVGEDVWYSSAGLFVSGNVDTAVLKINPLIYGVAGLGPVGVLGDGKTGVFGKGRSNDNSSAITGVIGLATRTTASQNNVGVYGQYADGADVSQAWGAGVAGLGPGYAGMPASRHIGVYGSAVTYGILGDGSTGVYGKGRSTDNSYPITGVIGMATRTVASQNNVGVFGQYANGAYGSQAWGAGVVGFGPGYQDMPISSHIGVFGAAMSYGILGKSLETGIAGEGFRGVMGISNVASGIGVDAAGFIGLHAISDKANGTGIMGYYTAQSPTTSSGSGGAGVFGAGFYGVSGLANTPGIPNSTTSVGIRGEAKGANSIAVWGIAPTPGANFQWAGYFTGNVNTIGNTYVSGSKNFKIDHPLDPENKYLIHSCVESDEMANMYNGTVTTDAKGYAKVQLPDWFEAENENFKYQLTCIGQFAQAIIKQKISNNSFIIQTDKAAVEVSWQVVGNRKDVYAKKSGFKVEVEKTAEEKGRYLNASYYGLPIERSINYPATADSNNKNPLP